MPRSRPPSRLLLVSTLIVACGGPGDGEASSEGAGSSSSADESTSGASESTSETGASETSASGAETADATTGAGVEPLATDENLRVAFFGDHGQSLWSLANLQLIREENADFLIVLGDFDYDDMPPVWDSLLNTGLGGEFPVFAAIGNHDVEAWDGYQQVLRERFDAIAGADCQGEMGVQASCYYRGLHFLLSGVGTMGEGHEDFIESELLGSDAIWKICAWHKNQNDMQLGEKGDEVGWGAYQACQRGGAIVATGHEHSYGRTMTLTALGDVDAGHGAVGDPTVMEVGPDKTFVFVSGLGGASIRKYIPALHDDDTWWASYYTDDRWLKASGEVDDDYVAEAGSTRRASPASPPGRPRRAGGKRRPRRASPREHRRRSLPRSPQRAGSTTTQRGRSCPRSSTQGTRLAITASSCSALRDSGVMSHR